MNERALGKHHVGHLPFPSSAADWRRLYLSSAWDALRGPGPRGVERFCFFIGYARSGHSLIGSVLNAHPEMVIAHELNAVRYVAKGFRRAQLFALILRRDRDFGAIGRVWTGYDYSVPGQFQGRFTRLTVIGDKKGARSAEMLSRQPELLDRVRRTVRVPIRVVHITRNPFDNIVTQSERREMTLAEATRWYDESCRAVARVRAQLTPAELIDLPHEGFTEDPRGFLTELCGFLGVEPGQSYLDDCAAIVWPSTKRRRDGVKWSPEQRRAVEEIIGRNDFLARYSFEN
jgi:hypothetical protein